MIASGARACAAHLEAINGLAAALEAIGGDPPPAPRWNQDWFPRLDAAAAYAMVRRHRPLRIVEVGSGHSTRFMARAVADGGLETRITAIDPRPRASLDGLTIELLRTRVQSAGHAPFDSLSAGDFLFVDSSHQYHPGSDVAFIFEQILPALPGGVFVHFHDIFLPGGYPTQWAWRGYSEQPAVAALLADAGYAVEFSSAWIVACRPDWIAKGVLARLPLVPGALESSFWLRRIG
jgi:predicted O-methyltransferase YrrM